MNRNSKSVASLKAALLGDLQLWRSKDLQRYWAQVKWAKPDLTELGKSRFVAPPGHKPEKEKPGLVFAPLRYALERLPPETLVQASEQLDPFGWLLEAVDVAEWLQFKGVPQRREY